MLILSTYFVEVQGFAQHHRSRAFLSSIMMGSLHPEETAALGFLYFRDFHVLALGTALTAGK